MIDWRTLLIWCVTAFTTSFIVWLTLYCIVQRDSRNETAPEEKKRRTRRKWMRNLLLVAAVIFFILFPLEIIYSLYFSGPLSVIILFAIGLGREKRTEKDSEAVTAEESTSRRKLLIIFSVFLIVMLAVLACFLLLPAEAIAYM